VASIRYLGQSFPTEISAPNLDDVEKLSHQFRETHGRLYGFATNEPWELCALRCTISASRDNFSVGDKISGAAPSQPRKIMPCWFGGGDAVETTRYDRSKIASEQCVAGPAIIEDSCSTIVVPPGASATVNQTGHIQIDVGNSL